MKLKNLLVVVTVALGFGVAAVAQAELYSFSRINAGPDIGSNFFVDVSQNGGDVLFKFTNAYAGEYSSITSIYFDDTNTLISAFSIFSESAGVNFSDPASPPVLPNGNLISFSADYSADADNPNQLGNGVDSSSEWLTIKGVLSGNTSYADILSAIGQGDLRAGIFIQPATASGAGSYATNAVNTVPVPSAVWLFASALVGFVATTRKSRL